MIPSVLIRRAALALLVGLPAVALAQDTPKKAAKPPASASARHGKATLAKVNGVAIPQLREEVFVRERVAQGATDSPQFRAAVRDNLINIEVVAQEAARTGFSKRADLRAELDLVRQNVIAERYLSDWLRRHPITDKELKKEYDQARSQVGDKEYHAHHILVETENEAKSIIADLNKGAKFEDLAEQKSKDLGTSKSGGDLGWGPPARYDPVFAAAMTKLAKGKITEKPVHTRFGYHVIRLDDVRPLNFPTFEDLKPRIEQRVRQRKIAEYVRSLRDKAKIEE